MKPSCQQTQKAGKINTDNSGAGYIKRNWLTIAIQRLLVIAMVLVMVGSVNGCKLFKKEKHSINSVDTLLAHKEKLKADSLKKAKAAAQIALKEKARQDSLKMVEENKNSRVNAKYQIIAGSFKTPSLADRYNEKMKGMGFDAIIIQGKHNFQFVSIKGMSDFKAAANELRQIKASDESLQLWIYTQN